MTRAGCAVHFRFYLAQGKAREYLRLTACLALPSPARKNPVRRELFPAPCSEDDTLEFSIDLVFLTTANVDDAFHRDVSTGAAFMTALLESTTLAVRLSAQALLLGQMLLLLVRLLRVQTHPIALLALRRMPRFTFASLLLVMSAA